MTQQMQKRDWGPDPVAPPTGIGPTRTLVGDAGRAVVHVRSADDARVLDEYYAETRRQAAAALKVIEDLRAQVQQLTQGRQADAVELQRVRGALVRSMALNERLEARMNEGGPGWR